MHLLPIVIAAQFAAVTRPAPSVLDFPERGLDDTAAYQGYQTRFHRDAAGNTVQIYLDGRSGRVVHLWADAENASAGFTARDARGPGRALPLRWGAAEPVAIAHDSAGVVRTRWLTYELEAGAPHIHLGWFLLGSMRVERDFQYWKIHEEPFGLPPFRLREIDSLFAVLERLEPDERERHLRILRAADVAELRARTHPTVRTHSDTAAWLVRVVQPSLDALDTLALEVSVDPRVIVARHAGDSVSLQTRTGGSVRFTVSIATTGRTLTPLARSEIFNPGFLSFLDSAQRAAATAPPGDSAVIRARWLERQVRGVELLSSREKLMAGLPAYATYFGRDMLLSTMMMRPVWRHEVPEVVIASVLRKLSPTGHVSHEEALGGQAVREAAAEYAELLARRSLAIEGGNRAEADSLLARAREVLRDHRRVRENYHMVDDEFQLPVLVALWLDETGVPQERKRAFLLEAVEGGGTRLDLLLRALALVTRLTAPYAAEPVTANLVSFAQRGDGRWAATSWRDSGAGYAGGRYAMDVNAIWVPHALESTGRILEALRRLGISLDSLGQVVPEMGGDAPLGRYARDPAALRLVVDTWRGASRHFLVRLSPAAVRRQARARVAAMPAHERRFWNRVLARTGAARDSLVFLALALDARGRPIGVANSDPATRLFLRVPGAAREADVLRDVRLFVRPYPAGLFIDGVGPVVANDAYAPRAVWAAFERDRYHSPRVVWGREVNLFLIGVANHIAATRDSAYARELQSALARVLGAVEASGFKSELWSYEVRGGKVSAIRYGTGSDVQLWSTTDLAVAFALARNNLLKRTGGK